MKEYFEKPHRENTTDKLLNFRPVFFVAVFLCLGIAFGWLCFFKNVSFLWSGLLLPVIGILLYCFGSNRSFKKTVWIVLSLLLAFYFGHGVFIARAEKYTEISLSNGEYNVVGVVEQKTQLESFLELVLLDVRVEGKSQYGKLVAYLPTSFFEKVQLADELLLEGFVGRYEDFSAYNADENVRFKMYAEGVEVVGRSSNLFLRFRALLENTLYKNMERTSASLTVAVLTGNTGGISKGLLENMRYGGLAHVFAVSGLHVSALYLFSRFLTEKTKLRKLPKLAKFSTAALLLIIYGAVCGFSASIIRALTICLLLSAAGYIGMGSDMTENAGAAAIIVLLRSPFALFTVGFQLSFAAFLGIIWLNRPISNVCHALLKKLFRNQETRREQVDRPPSFGERVQRRIVSFFAVSTSAQIFTAPILLSAFGYLSGLALLLNCIFVPLLSLCFSFLLLTAILACILPFLAGILLYLPSMLWNALVLVFEVVDFSRFCIAGIELSGGAVALYYCALLFLTDKWNLNSFLKKVCFVGLCLLFGVGMYGLNG